MLRISTFFFPVLLMDKNHEQKKQGSYIFYRGKKRSKQLQRVNKSFVQSTRQVMHSLLQHSVL